MGGPCPPPPFRHCHQEKKNLFAASPSIVIVLLIRENNMNPRLQLLVRAAVDNYWSAENEKKWKNIPKNGL